MMLEHSFEPMSFVEGLLPIESIGRFFNDYFECESEDGLLRGQKGGKVINMGDELEVVLAQVEPSLRRINFAMDEESDERDQRRLPQCERCKAVSLVYLRDKRQEIVPKGSWRFKETWGKGSRSKGGRR